MGMSRQRYDPPALPRRKDSVLFYRKLGGPQGRSGWVRRVSPPPGLDPRTVQPVSSFILYATLICNLTEYGTSHQAVVHALGTRVICTFQEMPTRALWRICVLTGTK
jgi:hypothetical protein